MRVAGHRVDLVAGDTAGITLHMAVVLESLGLGLEQVEPAAESAQPEMAGWIFVHGPDEVRGDAGGVVGFVLEDLETVAVVAFQAVAGGKPYITLPILDDAEYHSRHQAAFLGPVVEACLSICDLRHGKDRSQQKWK